MELTQHFAGALLVVFLSKSVLGLPKYFKDCGSEKSVIQTVAVSGCRDTDVMCNLKKGSTVFVTVGFKTTEVITNATAVVTCIVYVAGIPVPFIFSRSDGCKSGLSCPVKQDASAVYRAEFYVPKYFPSLKVVEAMKLELIDQYIADIFCAVLKLKAVRGTYRV